MKDRLDGHCWCEGQDVDGMMRGVISAFGRGLVAGLNT
jgi:hypothetical protein